MKFSLASDGTTAIAPNRADGKKEQFRKQFQRNVRECVRRGFSLEESFGLVWTETLEELPLSDMQEFELYQQMLAWAKHGLLTGVFSRYSPQLSTSAAASLRENPKSYWVAGRM